MTASDCFGNEYATEKCCASISMVSEGEEHEAHTDEHAEEGHGGETYHMYRCLDMGLIGMNMDFKIGEDVQVSVKCDEGAVSSAITLTATITVAAALANLF